MAKTVGLTILAIAGLIAAFVVLHALSSPQGSGVSPSSRPHFTLTLQKAEYSHGYVKVVGVARNDGPGEAFSPTIEIEVLDGSTRLALDSVWPSGTFLKKMPAGSAAAFEAMARVPGEPRQVQYFVRMKDYTFNLTGPK